MSGYELEALNGGGGQLLIFINPLKNAPMEEIVRTRRIQQSFCQQYLFTSLPVAPDFIMMTSLR